MALNTERAARVMAAAAERGLSQLLVTDPLSIYYLTGVTTEPGERFFGLLMADGAAPVLFVNELFPLEHPEGCRFVSFTDADDVPALLARYIDAERVLGVDKNMPARFLVPLMESGAVAQVALGRLPSTVPARSRMRGSRSSCAAPRPSTTPAWPSSPRSCAKA